MTDKNISGQAKNAADSREIWDVVVIGGGPAGMMAAGCAAERGLRVLLLEKNDSLGKKLLITGGGRCNMTNAEFDTRKFLNKFKENNKYLFSAFSQFGVQESIDFFNKKGLETKIEAEGRVFPITDKAQSVWDVMVKYITEQKVKILTKAEVTGFVEKYNEAKKEKEVTAITLKNKKEILAKSFVLATGGKSHPETGSTGEGFEWLKKIGHTIIEPTASLVPLKITDAWVKKLQGISFKDIKLSLFQNNQKQSSVIGKILFTHFGVTGPTILNLSKEVSELLKYGKVVIELDMLPNLDYGILNQKLQETFKLHNKKKIKNSLSEILPSGVCDIVLNLAKIDTEKFSSNITREERLVLVKTIKHIPMNVAGLLGADKAIVTSGGVKLDEIDFKNMSSRIFPNLYLIGDVLNIDRPSGGYSLQLCWTTGFVAGNNIPL